MALVRYGGSGPDLPLGDIGLPYAQSKIASERVVRGLQEAGAPVTSIYPGAAYGPNDPYRGLRANSSAGCCLVVSRPIREEPSTSWTCAMSPR